jgi:REP element-mobilizing transposase RayT
MKKLPQRKNTRLKEYDYSTFGFYFATICLKDRKNLFSNIIESKVVLTKYGKIVDEILNNLPKYYNIELDYYIIMPDHIHLIIIIDKYLDKSNPEFKRIITLSDVVGKFKSYITKKIREMLNNKVRFEWQKSFYDRIIRNEKELYLIRKYIEDNPLRWEIEKNYPQNLEM